MLNRDEYLLYVKKFKYVYNKLYSNSHKDTIKLICNLRRYDYNRMYQILSKAGFVYIEKGLFDYKIFKSKEFDDMALFSDSGNPLLDGRFIFPVKDMLGNIVALIGWYPDSKKYITTPSRLFSKECLYYGLEQLSETGLYKTYVLVEGIFDSLSVRSLGLPCVANMGITSSRYKNVLSTMFKRVIAIPDNDIEGREVVEFDKWKISRTSKYMRWTGVDVKDIDDFIKLFEVNDVKSMLIDILGETERVVTVNLK